MVSESSPPGIGMTINSMPIVVTGRDILSPSYVGDSNRRTSILLVDDDPVCRSLLSDALMYQGHQVYEATDGVTGLEQFSTIQPDLVLVDVLISGLDGLTILREIRQQNQSVGILMLSILRSKKLILEVMAAGADGFVGKPFDLRGLYREIQSLRKQVDQRRTELYCG